MSYLVISKFDLFIALDLEEEGGARPLSSL